MQYRRDLHTGVWTAHRLLLHCGTRARTVGRVGALISRSFEEVVLQSVVRGDTCFGIVIEHPQDEVLELQVVGELVACFALPSASRSATLDSQNIVQFPRPR